MRITILRLSFVCVLASTSLACSSTKADDPATDAGAGPDASSPDAGPPDASGDAAVPPSSDATLVDLTLSVGALSPTFATATTAYTTSSVLPVLLGGSATTVTATAHAGATLTINGASAMSGAPSTPITLKLGPTPIDVGVTAADGTTTKHYTIVVSARGEDYLKASNTRQVAAFGRSVAVSGDTLVVGSSSESSNATTVNGDQADTSAPDTGAVYVFRRKAGAWAQEAYLKAATVLSYFGNVVAISGDTIVVGTQTGEAVYVFARAGTSWSQSAELHASNARPDTRFGTSVAIDGQTLVVGAIGESSSATTVGGNQADTAAPYSGAAYVFTRGATPSSWSQQAYLKASSSGAGASFGAAVAISGNTIIASAPGESSIAAYSGAAYVFTRAGTVWSEQKLLKASNARPGLNGFGTIFGASVAISGDTAAVGATYESSNATGVNGNESDESADRAGAAYVYARTGTTWTQQAYVKASNTRAGAQFGSSVALDGNTLAVGSWLETSNATDLNGDATDASLDQAGAAYLFTRTGTAWAPKAYIKASNTRSTAWFGLSIALSKQFLAVGSYGESSNAKGVNGDPTNMSANGAGATYVFE